MYPQCLFSKKNQNFANENFQFLQLIEKNLYITWACFRTSPCARQSRAGTVLHAREMMRSDTKLGLYLKCRRAYKSGQIMRNPFQDFERKLHRSN